MRWRRLIFKSIRELVAAIPSDHQTRLRHRRANTSPYDSPLLRILSGSAPRSKRRRWRNQRQTIGPAFHRAEPKTSGADRRLSWSLGVASRQLRSMPLTNHFTYLIKFGSHPYCVDLSTALRPPRVHFSSAPTLFERVARFALPALCRIDSQRAITRPTPRSRSD
jgi:hypothetical protein